MKFTKIFFGILAIVAAVLLILDATDVISPLTSTVGDVSVFAVVLGIMLLSFAISRLIKGKIGEIFFPLAFIFMLFEKNVSVMIGRNGEDLINNWLVLLIALLLSIGFSILFHKKKNHHIKCCVETNIPPHSHAGGSLGSSTVYVDSANITPNHIENNLGSCHVYFENPERYAGGATLYVENNLGAMIINIPAAWKINTSIENNLGGVTIPKNDDTERPILYIKGENNLGSLTVRYI